ncbi:MAG: GHKL domain-containing protein [Pseudomonadales bacterium]|jgi:nitrogen fixation/metabolism regulation signal transduction histidine kinase|nr:GHKL domain-containing protein [Pseudomonadales bacterium]
MGFKLKLALQLAALLITTWLLGWATLASGYRATQVALALLLCAQIAGLWRTLTTTNRELTRFLTAISHNDFTQSFKPVDGGGGFRELGQAFEAIIERFREARSDKELQAAYLSAFIERMPIAVLALAGDGRILHSNRALQDLLHLPAPPPSLAQIRQHHPQLAPMLEQLQPDQSVNLQIKSLGEKSLGETRNLKLACTILRSRGQQQKLITLQNIQHELDAQELAAWQNLIRVMAHEIMNSITPITSLADTAAQCLDDSRAHPAAQSDPQLIALLDDIDSALGTIGSRSQALLRFVDSYRRLSRLPTPLPRLFSVQELFMQVQRLVEVQVSTVHFTTHCEPPELKLHADQEQLEQALLNLINNALDAIREHSAPRLALSAWQQSGRILLRVEDNGCGMTPAQLEQIFVPFFTTKRGGNGIGMSVVRQIVHLNGGRIEVQSSPGAGTQVLLSFG